MLKTHLETKRSNKKNSEQKTNERKIKLSAKLMMSSVASKHTETSQEVANHSQSPDDRVTFDEMKTERPTIRGLTLLLWIVYPLPL